MNINFYYKSSFYQHWTAQIQMEPKCLRFDLCMSVVVQWGIWANREKKSQWDDLKYNKHQWSNIYKKIPSCLWSW